VVAGLLPGLAATDGAGLAAGEYFGVRSLAIPASMVFFGVREVRYGLGDSRWPMLASLVANAANVGLNYLLIFVLGWGVAGAAWGTVAANLLELALLMAVQARDGLGLGDLRWRHVASLATMGWPTGLQFLIEMGSFTLLTVMVSRYSEAHMAAHQITIQVIHFSFLPAVALGEACSVMVGQAVGALREQLVRRVARLTMWAAGIYAGTCTLVFALGGRLIGLGFTDDPELLRLTVQLLAIAAVFQVFDAANIIGRAALRGTGDVRFPAVLGVTLAWLATPPSMWLLGYQLGLGAVGGWIGLCVELVLGAGIFWWRLEREHWREAMARARALRASAA
jgi:MATE family multidrug resistance protein